MIGLSSQTAHPRVSVIGRKRGADVLRPLSHEHPGDDTFAGLLIVRPEGRLYFGNAQCVAERIDALVAEQRPRVLVLGLSRVPDVEYSALQLLAEADRRRAQDGIVVWLAGLNPGVLETMRHSALYAQFGPQRLLFNARAAITRYQALPAQTGS